MSFASHPMSLVVKSLRIKCALGMIRARPGVVKQSEAEATVLQHSMGIGKEGARWRSSW